MPGMRLVLTCVSAGCVAGLGYHATDKSPRPPLPPLAIFIALGAGLLLVCGGCTLGGFAVGVKSNTFGSVVLAADGGAIGKEPMPTNSVPALPVLPP